MSLFGWDLPPGCSQRDIDALFADGSLDCSVCNDGIELDGPDCVTNVNHGPVCEKHGCITCLDLEKQRPVAAIEEELDFDYDPREPEEDDYVEEEEEEVRPEEDEEEDNDD